MSKRNRGPLVEQDSHSLKRSFGELDFDETLLGMGQNGKGLFKLNAWKPFEKFVNRCPGFQVLEQGSHRHAGATKNPRATELAFTSFYLLTIAPIQHAQHDMLPFRPEQ